MLVAGAGHAVHRRGNIVDAEHEMIVGRDMPPPLDAVSHSQQRDDMARAG